MHVRHPGCGTQSVFERVAVSSEKQSFFICVYIIMCTRVLSCVCVGGGGKEDKRLCLGYLLNGLESANQLA